jgi:hypothetical protein
MKILLGDFNAKVSRKDIFNPKLRRRVCKIFVSIMELEQ